MAISLTITLDYDKNIYLSPNRSTVNLTNDLDSSTKHIVDEDLHNTLIEARDMQWIKKRAAPGYKTKRVKWYLLLDAFMKDYSDTQSLDQGPRMTALLKKAKIKDTVAANTTAIDSGMYESSAASGLKTLASYWGMLDWMKVLMILIITGECCSIPTSRKNLRREETET